MDAVHPCQLEAFKNISIGIPDSNGVRAYYAAADTRLYRSLDRGLTWPVLPFAAGSAGSGLRIAASRVNPNSAYLMSWSLRKLYKSSDSGVTWVDSTNGFSSFGKGSAFGAAVGSAGNDSSSREHEPRPIEQLCRPLDIHDGGWDFRRYHQAPDPNIVFFGNNAGLLK